jgi:8-oxo-dGTP pyrophosphatase MutT (NUDIX family)/phosphohistidine phosphatase SixA
MAVGPDRFIEAAGGVLWRPALGGQGVEVALVHRPKYDDWSVPKGKLLPGEHPLVGGLREVAEETGITGRPGRALGEVRYLKDGSPKRVRYWAVEAAEGEFAENGEVDQVMWPPPREAAVHLSADRDRPIVEAFARDVRVTAPYVVVRHGSAGERATFEGDDRERPLDDLGHRQALALIPVLAALRVERVLSADVLRCLDTVGPFAAQSRLSVQSEPLLSESGYSAAPDAAAERLVAVLEGEPIPTTICSQGKVIPSLLQRVCADLKAPTPWDGTVPKGGFVVLNIARPRASATERTKDRTKDRNTVASVDRYRPIA